LINGLFAFYISGNPDCPTSQFSGAISREIAGKLGSRLPSIVADLGGRRDDVLEPVPLTDDLADDPNLGGWRDDVIDDVEVDAPGSPLDDPLEAEDDGRFDDIFR
jgi:hypothetical protein